MKYSVLKFTVSWAFMLPDCAYIYKQMTQKSTVTLALPHLSDHVGFTLNLFTSMSLTVNELSGCLAHFHKNTYPRKTLKQVSWCTSSVFLDMLNLALWFKCNSTSFLIFLLIKRRGFLFLMEFSSNLLESAKNEGILVITSNCKASRHSYGQNLGMS